MKRITVNLLLVLAGAIRAASHSLAAGAISNSMAPAPVVWVLHDEDSDYQNAPFQDTLTLLGDSGQVYLNKEEFNISQTIGGTRAIAAAGGNSVLVCEDVAKRMSRIDSSGNILFSIPGIWAVDVAADGTIYALDSVGTIYGSNILRLSPQGVVLDRVPGGGVDLVVDDQNQGVFVVGADIKYFTFDLTRSWSIDPFAWAAVSVEVAGDGSAWIAERRHDQVGGSANRLLRVSRFGAVLQTIDLAYSPYCVRVDRTDDSVYVASDQLYKYDPQGALQFSAPLGGALGWSLAIDANRQVWVGTWSDVRKFSPAGELLLATNRFSHPSDTYVAVARHSGPPPCSNCPPVILGQPVSRTNYVRSAATFHAPASGTQPLFHQWLKDGAVINGATNASFTITNTQFTDAGSYSVQLSNSFGSVISSNALLIVVPRRDYFTELFAPATNDLAFQQLTFTPDGSDGFYALCRQAVTNFPTDPAGGMTARLGDDNYSRVILSDGETVSLYGRRTNVFFIGSNGYLTFSFGDASYDLSLAEHFGLPRISALLTDLYVSGNAVSWRQLSDRVAVTFLNVSEYAASNRNSFQFELFFDGRIRLTYLRIESRSNLAGLSAGDGVPPDFEPSDLSAYGLCVVYPLLISDVTVGEGNAGTSDAVFAVSLATNHADIVSVDFATADGTAMAGSDYAATSGTLIFAPGETNKIITVPVLGDVLDEIDEWFFVQLSNPTNLSLIQTQAVATIFDDDTALRIIAQPGNQAVSPGSTAVLRISAISTFPPITYQWRLNAADIEGATNDILTITNVQRVNEGLYSVQVTDGLGSVISESARLALRLPSINVPPSFAETFSYSLGNYWCENHLSVADMDGDGRKDIVLMATALANTNGPPWSYLARAILLRAGADGTFTDSVITNFPGRYGYGAFAAELNNDGATDLILREGSATYVLLNDGHGAFREVWSGSPGYYNLAAVDANRDGFLDIVSGTQSGSGGLIELFINNGAGTGFTSTWESRYFGSGYDSIQTVLNVNLNNDGLPDIAVREIYGGRMVTLLGGTNGTAFTERQETFMGDRTFALAAGRVNGDALDDLAASVGWGVVRVFTNRNDGSMSSYWEGPSLGQGAYGLALADFDQDGFDDIFVGTFGDGLLRIYRNNPGAGFVPWWQGSVPGQGYTGQVADVNGDGQPDLIVGEKGRLRVLINRTGCPRIARLQMTGQGPTVTWSALPGRTYRVQFKNRMHDSEWTDLDGDVTASSTTASKTDGSTGAESQRLYRVVKLP